jgi:hypothetical protein
LFGYVFLPTLLGSLAYDRYQGIRRVYINTASALSPELEGSPKVAHNALCSKYKLNRTVTTGMIIHVVILVSGIEDKFGKLLKNGQLRVMFGRSKDVADDDEYWYRTVQASFIQDDFDRNPGWAEHVCEYLAA